jgi:hypothetical protein
MDIATQINERAPTVLIFIANLDITGQNRPGLVTALLGTAHGRAENFPATAETEDRKSDLSRTEESQSQGSGGDIVEYGCQHDVTQCRRRQTWTEDAGQCRDTRHVRFSGDHLSSSARVLDLTTCCVTSRGRHGTTVATARGFNRGTGLPDPAAEASVQCKDKGEQCDYPLSHKIEANPFVALDATVLLRCAVAQGGDPLAAMKAAYRLGRRSRREQR